MRQTISLISYVVIFSVLLIFHLHYYEGIIVAAIVTISTVHLYFLKQSMQKEYEGEIVIRQQKGSNTIIYFGSAIAILYLLIYAISGKINILNLSLYLFAILFNTILNILIKKYKPVKIIVNANNLTILNDNLLENRDLTELLAITFNGFFNTIEMNFEGQNKFYFAKNEFLISDIKTLIEVCTERTQQTLSISDNLTIE